MAERKAAAEKLLLVQSAAEAVAAAEQQYLLEMQRQGEAQLAKEVRAAIGRGFRQL